MGVNSYLFVSRWPSILIAFEVIHIARYKSSFYRSYPICHHVLVYLRQATGLKREES